MKPIFQLNKHYTGLRATLAQYDVRSLSVFRILISLYCIGQVLVLKEHWMDLYGASGIIPWDLSRDLLEDTAIHLSDLSTILQISEDSTVLLVVYAYLGCLCCLCIGFYANVSAFFALLLHTLLLNTADFFTYGAEIFAQISLFYCVFTPVGNYFAIDNLFRADKRPNIDFARFCLLILQIHLCLVYASSGIEKSLGVQWWNGEAIWRALMLPQFSQANFSWLAHYYIICKVIGWMTMLIETLYPILIWTKYRAYILLSMILMHLGIGICLGLWMFSCIMILLNISLFGYSFLPKINQMTHESFKYKRFIRLQQH